MLVGRDTEVDHLLTLVGSSASGGAGWIHLIGDPGCGKSATCAAVVERLEDVVTVRHCATEWERAMPWSTVIAVVRQIDADGPLAEELRGATAGGSMRAVLALALDLADVLAGAAIPVVVWVDDWHWVDDASARLLAAVGRHLAGTPATLLTAGRPSDAPMVPDATIGTTVQLAPLDDAALDRLAAALGVGSERVRRALVAHASGRPAALRAAAHALDAGQRAGIHPLPDHLPVGRELRSWYSPSLDALSAAARHALAVAAADSTGRARIVHQAWELLGIDAGVLDELLDSGLITLWGDELGFDHPVARTTAYETMKAADRRAAHAALAVVHERDGEMIAGAWHAARSAIRPDPTVAGRCAAAAALAASTGAGSSAAHLYEQAASLAGDAPSAHRWWLDAAHAALTAGDLERARRFSAHAPADTPRAIACRVDVAVASGDLLDAAAAIESLAAMGTPADAMHRAALLRAATALVPLAYASNRSDLVRRAAGIARSLTEGVGSIETVRVELAEGVSLVLDGERRAGLALIDRWPLLTRSGDASDAAYIAGTVAVAYSFSGRRDDARRLLEQLLDGCRVDQAAGAAIPILGGLAVACYGNDLERSLDAGRRMMDLAADTGLRGATVAGLSATAFAAAAMGDRVTCERAADALSAVGDELSAWAALAKLALFEDDPHEAVRLLSLAEADPRRATTHHRWQNDLAEALIRLGRADEVEPHLARLDRWAEAGDAWARGQSLRLRALLASDDRALALFEEAAAALAMMTDNPYALGVAEFAWGARLRRMRHRAAARSRLASARELFVRCGATAWVARCDDEITASGGQRSAGAELTLIEQRVNALAALGASNREIASRLFISVRTVETHISSIYRKLGVRTRAELVAYSLAADAAGQRSKQEMLSS